MKIIFVPGWLADYMESNELELERLLTDNLGSVIVTQEDVKKYLLANSALYAYMHGNTPLYDVVWSERDNVMFHTIPSSFPEAVIGQKQLSESDTMEGVLSLIGLADDEQRTEFHFHHSECGQVAFVVALDEAAGGKFRTDEKANDFSSLLWNILRIASIYQQKVDGSTDKSSALRNNAYVYRLFLNTL